METGEMEGLVEDGGGKGWRQKELKLGQKDKSEKMEGGSLPWKDDGDKGAGFM